MAVIIFIIALAVLIFVHELGHFLAAKKSGITVDEFGLGFPPKLWSKRIGETTYTLNALPFGGFVKIFGEDPHEEVIAEADKPRSFYYKPKWVQALVLVAGVSFNVLFAWLLISIGFAYGLPAPVEHDGYGTVANAHTVVTNVLSGSPADKAGLQPGDTLLFVSAGDAAVQDGGVGNMPEQISKLIAESKDKDIEVIYQRGDNAPATLVIPPSTNIVEGRRVIGISMDMIGTLKLPLPLAFVEGARSTIFLVKNTVVGLGQFLWGAVTLHSDFSQVSGPVGIASVVSKSSSLGFEYFISLIALISVNLAVINLVPFPALDGGRLLFVAVEAIIRRPIPARVSRAVNTVGFIILLGLMLLITGHDILKLL